MSFVIRNLLFFFVYNFISKHLAKQESNCSLFEGKAIIWSNGHFLYWKNADANTIITTLRKSENMYFKCKICNFPPTIP